MFHVIIIIILVLNFNRERVIDYDTLYIKHLLIILHHKRNKRSNQMCLLFLFLFLIIKI